MPDEVDTGTNVFDDRGPREGALEDAAGWIERFEYDADGVLGTRELTGGLKATMPPVESNCVDAMGNLMV